MKRDQYETTQFSISDIDIESFTKEDILKKIDEKFQEIQFEKYEDNVYVVISLSVPLPEGISDKQKKTMMENGYPERVTAQSLLIESFNYVKRLVVEKPYKAMGKISTKYAEGTTGSLMVSVSPGLIID
jgi:hypothetical protein